jgi:hypothetical protein
VDFQNHLSAAERFATWPLVRACTRQEMDKQTAISWKQYITVQRKTMKQMAQHRGNITMDLKHPETNIEANNASEPHGLLYSLDEQWRQVLSLLQRQDSQE